MTFSRRTKAILGVAGAIAVAIAVLRFAAAYEASASATSARLPGAWTAPDRERLLTLRDEVTGGDHRFTQSLADAVPNGSVYQQLVLADGNLTLDEYRQASSDWAACMATSGVTVPELRMDGLGRFNNQPLRFAPEELATGMAAVARCDAGFRSTIGFVWAASTVRLSKEVERASRTGVAACFRATGLKPVPRPWEAADPGTREAFMTCMRDVQAELGVAAGFGMDGDGLPAS